MGLEKWRSPIFEKKFCVQIIHLFVSKLVVFGHFLEIASLDFANFAYFDRWDWYLTNSSDCCSKENFLYVISHIDAVNMRKNAYFAIYFGLGDDKDALFDR